MILSVKLRDNYGKILGSESFTRWLTGCKFWGKWPKATTKVTLHEPPIAVGQFIIVNEVINKTKGQHSSNIRNNFLAYKTHAVYHISLDIYISIVAYFQISPLQYA